MVIVKCYSYSCVIMASIQPLFIKIFEVEIGGRISDSHIVMLCRHLIILIFGLFVISVEWIALVFTLHMSHCIA